MSLNLCSVPLNKMTFSQKKLSESKIKIIYLNLFEILNNYDHFTNFQYVIHYSFIVTFGIIQQRFSKGSVVIFFSSALRKDDTSAKHVKDMLHLLRLYKITTLLLIYPGCVAFSCIYIYFQQYPPFSQDDKPLCSGGFFLDPKA